MNSSSLGGAVKLLAFLLLFSIAGSALGQTIQLESQSEKRKVISQIVEKLQLSKLIEQQVKSVVAMVQSQAPLVVSEANIPASQRDKATRILISELSSLNGKLHASTMETTVEAYAAAFTLSELKELLAFYQTPTGRKLTTELPRLQAEGIAKGKSEGDKFAYEAMCSAFAKFKQEGISAAKPPFCK